MLKIRVTSRTPLVLFPGPLVLLVVGGDDDTVTVSYTDGDAAAVHSDHRVGEVVTYGGRTFKIVRRFYDGRDGESVDLDEITVR